MSLTEKLLWAMIAIESVGSIGMWWFYIPYKKLQAQVKGREEAYVRNSEITLKTIDSFVAERSAHLEKLHNFQLQVADLQHEISVFKAKEIQ